MVSQEDIVKEVLSKDIQNKFTTILFNMLDDFDFRKTNKNVFTAYLYLRRHIVRKARFNSINKTLYKKYYKNGLLAASIPVSKIAEAFGMKPNNKAVVIKWITSMKQYGWIKTTNTNIGKGKPQSVYVLGTHTVGDNGHCVEECYFDNIDVE